MISGHFWKGPPYRCLLAAEARLAVLVLSDRIVLELREKLTDKFALPAVEVDAIIDGLNTHAEQVRVQGRSGWVQQDPDDDKFIDAALSGGATIIVSGEHGVTVSYSFLKQTLQAAGLVKKHRARGRHRRRREPRACFGELLHIDGSPHAWLALRPTEGAVLIAVLDDATKRVLYAQRWARETTVAIMSALREVITTQGLPMAVYTDRAHWAFNTPQANGPLNRRQLTQVGRAFERLGIEHIPAYSPQARGRSERLNRTFQDRLVNELRVAKITILTAANTYLRDRFLPVYNATFSCAPKDPTSAFVPVGKVDLEQILCGQITCQQQGSLRRCAPLTRPTRSLGSAFAGAESTGSMLATSCIPAVLRRLMTLPSGRGQSR